MAEATDLADSGSSWFRSSLQSAGQLARDRLLSFGVVYVAIFVFLLLYVFTVQFAEIILQGHFQERANRAVNITGLDEPVPSQIQNGIRSQVESSGWLRFGGVEANTIVLASDGITWLYVNGQIVPQPEGLDPTDVLRQAVQQLPATANVSVSVPHNTVLANSILIAYAAILIWGLYAYNRTLARRHQQQMELALGVRDEAARRAAQIEAELKQTRQRLAQIEPAEREQSEEIAAMQRERRSLQSKLGSLAAREEELLGKADRATDLVQEVRALEDLLEEAASDLEAKDGEIQSLEKNLKKASKGSSGRARGTDTLARRLRLLYKGVEIDDRAVDDLVALRDEGMILKAEEKLKRLDEEADNVAVRRKVGGLPDHLSIFELGFAGKGRIYYTKGKQRRFRVLCVGAKNSQDADLDYMRRLSRDDMA
jgi:hypothetical protein